MGRDRYAVPGRLRGWRDAGPGAAHALLDGAILEIAVARDGAVRLRAAAGDSLPPDPGPAIGRLPWRPAAATPRSAEGGGLHLLHEGPEGFAEVEVEPEPLRVRVREGRRRLLAELTGLELGEDGSARIALLTAPDERFFGFGEKAGRRLDKRGSVLRMRNRDANVRTTRDPLYVSIPFFIALRHDDDGSRARGVFLDAPAPSRFDVAAADPGRVLLTTEAGGLDLTLLPGPRPADVLRRFTGRVGRTPRPPLWSLGHHQSRWSYKSEKEVRAVAAELRRREIPTDAIHLDIDHMDGYRVFTFDRRRFPDPKSLCADLRREGFRLVAIVDPGVKVDRDYGVFREGRARRVFCRTQDGRLPALRVWPGDAALPDFNREEVRAWWGEQHRPLLDAGVSGIWNDMNEPAGWSRDLRLGRLMLPWRDQDLSDVEQADPADPERRVPHEHVRNLYGHQQCRATRAFLESAEPDRRPFVLSRSGFAGIQQYAALWTGDSLSRWEHLRESIPMLLGLSVSGVAFCGADIGGFALSCTPELYARWIQIGALQPFARTHSMWMKRRQEPWRFGRRVEAIAREALELRMRLLPYLYGLFAESERSGTPVWRPLFYEFPDDPEAAGVDDQVMVGPSLLAAPVCERGARERELYLPAGTWLDFHGDAAFTGPARVRVPAPLSRMPLFARAGSVIPTRSPVPHVGAAPDEPCVLLVFPGADGGGLLVEDDGESRDYERGREARTELRMWNRAGGRLRLEIGRREGSFAVPPRILRASFRAVGPPRAVFWNAEAIPRRESAPGFRCDGARVHVRLPDRGEGHTVELDLGS